MLKAATPAKPNQKGYMNPDVEHLDTQLGRAYEMADEWEKARRAY